MITKELIENRINNFLGYGNLNSDIWFIGMEEGFDGTLEELEQRFKATYNKKVIDIQNDMGSTTDHMKWFVKNPPLQRTYSKIARMLLLFGGKEISNNIIRNYQSNQLARIDSNHCLLEFMPLPNRSLNKSDWLYQQFNIDYLQDRKTYLNIVRKIRNKLFKNLIKEHNPKIVIYYSLTYLDKWSNILEAKFTSILSERLYCYELDGTCHFVTPHPTAHGLTNKEWDNISKEILNKSAYGKAE
jgi:hypothetical protein